MANHTGATCVGVDINAHGIEAAKNRAERDGISSLVAFQVVDAGSRLPFRAESFDAVFSNDSINHLPDRSAVLHDWYRLLRPGGRVLFTDPIVVTGQLSNEEIRTRSSIGFFLFTPVGHNERLLERTGFTIREVQDVTDAVELVSKKWRDARAARRERLVPLEGAEGFEGLQRFLDAVYILASERRLSRYMYLAEKSRLLRTTPNQAMRPGARLRSRYQLDVSQVMKSSSACRALAATNSITFASSTKPRNGVLSGIKSNGATK
jgi:SAM-dependent methyltransferase